MVSSRSIRRLFDVLLFVFFAGFLVSSLIGTFVDNKTLWSETEKRSLALFPPLPSAPGEITPFFAALDEYLNDHFGFRTFYINRYNRELDKWFNIASASSKVIKGLDGWYFLNNFNLLQDFLGLVPLTKEQLKAWLARQGEKQAWLQQRGIRYLYMAVPNKQTVYPQFLMEHALSKKGTTRFEQLRILAGGQLPDYMIDLHQVLRPELFDKPLYYKNDSHWNQFGAYVAFREIMHRISVWFPQQEFVTEFAFGPDITGIGGNIGLGGDLTMMLMQRQLTETYPQMKRFRRCGSFDHIPFALSNVIEGQNRDSFMRTCKSRNLRAVVFRDSFFVSLEPFLSENFREVIYLWKDYDQKNLEEILIHFQPDIVIEAIVERHAFDSLLKTETKNKQ
jgi:alginate O-acetyltransferase complex protein AlgJ